MKLENIKVVSSWHVLLGDTITTDAYCTAEIGDESVKFRYKYAYRKRDMVDAEVLTDRGDLFIGMTADEISLVTCSLIGGPPNEDKDGEKHECGTELIHFVDGYEWELGWDLQEMNDEA